MWSTYLQYLSRKMNEKVECVDIKVPRVLILCLEFRELSHLTRNLSQAEKKINVVTSWANAQNDIYFTQNGQSCHFEWK